MVWYDTPDCTEATIGQSLRLLVSNLVLVVIVLASSSSPRRVSAATLHVPGAFPTIQNAIDAATTGDTVSVAPGIHTGTVWFHGKNIVVRSEAGPETTILKRDVAAGGSIVDIGPAGEFVGFTVTEGRQPFGAGLHVHGDGTSIHGNIFDRNVAGTGGGGAAVWGDYASPVMERNVFRGNFCDTQFGGGVISFVGASSPIIQNNVFVDNPCRAITMTLITGASPLVVNNTIARNRGGVWIYRAYPMNAQRFKNNIIVANGVGFEALFGDDTSNPAWNHNLVFGNDVDYSGAGDQTGMAGNISADPLFVDEGAGDFRLTKTSPAVDAGTNTLAPANDFAGTSRPLDGNGDGVAITDIGAFEFAPPPATVTPTTVKLRTHTPTRAATAVKTAAPAPSATLPAGPIIAPALSPDMERSQILAPNTGTGPQRRPSLALGMAAALLSCGIGLTSVAFRSRQNQG